MVPQKLHNGEGSDYCNMAMVTKTDENRGILQCGLCKNKKSMQKNVVCFA